MLDLRRAARAAGLQLNESATFLPIPVGLQPAAPPSCDALPGADMRDHIPCRWACLSEFRMAHRHGDGRTCEWCPCLGGAAAIYPFYEDVNNEEVSRECVLLHV